jgi:amino acid transporter
MNETTITPSAMVPRAIKRATLLPLIGITYCMVAGGPYGLEDIISAAGYRTAILLLIVTPIFWSFPVTLMVSELSTAMPEDGGYYIWVRRAMGPFWGFQEAWLSLAASLFDMALYPTTFILYLARIWPPAGGETLSIWIGVALIAACVGINLLGIRLVGAGSVAMTLAMLLPFAVLVAIGFCLHPHGAALVSTAPAVKISWISGIYAVIWNYMGWDNASTIAGEVDRPQRTYPLAMLASVILVAFTYVMPVAAAARTGIAPGEWDTGSWVNAGQAIGTWINPQAGRILAIAITAGGMISAFSMFNALILSYSRVPVAMADDGFLPRFMGLRNRRTGVPWAAIISCAIFWGIFIRLGFEELLLLDATLYGLSLILEFIAMIVLRVREPDLPRPYKLPGGIPACVLLTIGPALVLCFAFYKGLSDDDSRKGLLISGILVAAGVILYFAAKWINLNLRKPQGR